MTFRRLLAPQGERPVEVFHAFADDGLGVAEQEELAVRHGSPRSYIR